MYAVLQKKKSIDKEGEIECIERKTKRVEEREGNAHMTYYSTGKARGGQQG